MATPTRNAPASMYRSQEGLGIWEHKGKVAAVGIGHSPTARRWDGTAESSMAAWAIIAARNAIADAGVSPDDIDGVITSPGGLGEAWGRRPVPEDFARTYQLTPGNNNDGLSEMSADFLVRNMPELKNVKFTMHGPGCMSNALCVAAEAVGSGLTNTCIVLTARGNLEGRYGQSGNNAGETAAGGGQWSMPWGATGPWTWAFMFDQYCRKYGGDHDMMANFVVQEKQNGLMFPEGYWAQHRPEVLTREDYLNARWIAKPANIFDCDIPIQVAVAYIFTTPERARNMKQKPIYVLNHASTRPRNRGQVMTLEECEASTDSTARKLYEGSGLTWRDVDLENMYDGYTLFHQYYLEALQWHGVKRGEALQFYQEDLSVHGPHPISSSGGNAGSGRTRIWMHTDSIQQLQGRAGQRQVRIKNGRPETAVSGGPLPTGGDFVIWSTSPD